MSLFWAENALAYIWFHFHPDPLANGRILSSDLSSLVIPYQELISTQHWGIFVKLTEDWKLESGNGCHDSSNMIWLISHGEAEGPKASLVPRTNLDASQGASLFIWLVLSEYLQKWLVDILWQWKATGMFEWKVMWTETIFNFHFRCPPLSFCSLYSTWTVSCFCAISTAHRLISNLNIKSQIYHARLPAPASHQGIESYIGWSCAEVHVGCITWIIYE
jgi:hypothetical protein